MSDDFRAKTAELREQLVIEQARANWLYEQTCAYPNDAALQREKQAVWNSVTSLEALLAVYADMLERADNGD